MDLYDIHAGRGQQQPPPPPGPFFPINPANLMGCDRLGHFWDKHGDCRYCPANQEDLEGPEA